MMPFGIDDALALSLIGGAIGGLGNKKNPLMGAALGAAGGYGAAQIPGLLATGAAEASLPAEAVQAAKPAGLLGDIKPYMDSAKPYLETAGQVGKAAMAANQVKGLLSPTQAPIQPSPVAQSGGGFQSIAQLANGMQQAQLQQQQDELNRRAQRRAMWG